jgi:hypothetical protein
MKDTFEKRLKEAEKIVEHQQETLEQLKELTDYVKKHQANPTDPKYIHVPNICFSLTDVDDKREEEFSKQRMERGFDDSETWALDSTIARFISPRLIRYQEIANDFLERDKDLVKNIDKLIKAFELIVKSNGSLWMLSKSEMKKIEEGLSKFPEVFLTLWW